MPIQSLSDSTSRPSSGKRRDQARSRAHCTAERSRSAKIKKRTPKNSWSIQLLLKVVPNFSEIIRPIVQNEAFLLSNDAISAFHLMKNKFAEATLQPIDQWFLTRVAVSGVRRERPLKDYFFENFSQPNVCSYQKQQRK